tara:strand:- start:7 stop:360 length:354 start_codon:yes stop_codon:yes gene_type:complete
MNLAKVKMLVHLGSSYEGAYGVCLRELTKIEGQLPPHKSPRPRAESAKMDAVRYTDGLHASTEQAKKINAMLRKKISQKDIAQILGVSTNTVSKTKARYNMPTRLTVNKRQADKGEK